MAVRTASKQKPALGRLPCRPTSTCLLGFHLADKLSSSRPISLNYDDGTAENLCQPLVAVFNSLLFVESRLSRSPIELSFRPGNAPIWLEWHKRCFVKSC